MKYKIILLVIFIVRGGLLFAQQYKDLLAGNWVFTAAKYADNGLLYNSSVRKEYISFSDNGKLQWHQYYFTNVQPARPDTVYLLYTGTWKLEGNVLTTTIATEKTTGAQQQSYKKTQTDTIVQLNAETLVLRTAENVYLYYIKTTLPAENYMNTQRENKGLYLTTPGTINTRCGDTLPASRLVLKHIKGRRKITIDNFKPLSLTLAKDTALNKFNWHQLEGQYISLYNNNLWMNVNSEYISEFKHRGGFMQSQYYYYGLNSGDTLVCRPIPVNQIASVTYSSRFRRTVHDISSFTLGAGLVSALIVSPLVNVQYKEGGFNGPRYLRWAGWSLAAVAVSIPLNVFSRPKTYSMNKWQIVLP